MQAGQPPVVRIRPLERRDLPLTLRWRNDPRSRFWFKTSAIIEEPAHLSWFERYQLEAREFMFFIETADAITPVGQGGIYNVDATRRDAEVGRFLSDPELRGRGLFRPGLMQILEHAARELALKSVHLEVIKSNERAIRLYRSVGFQDFEDTGDSLRMRLPLDRLPPAVRG